MIKKSYGGYGIDFNEIYTEQKEQGWKHTFVITFWSFVLIAAIFFMVWLLQQSIILACNHYIGLTLNH